MDNLYINLFKTPLRASCGFLGLLYALQLPVCARLIEETVCALISGFRKARLLKIWGFRSFFLFSCLGLFLGSLLLAPFSSLLVSPLLSYVSFFFLCLFPCSLVFHVHFKTPNSFRAFLTAVSICASL